MSEEILSRALLRFGVFELDLRAGELRKSGKLIRLAPQPYKLLLLLATKPGEVVTREQIQREIWGDDTVVDYEQGLSFLVKTVRAALGDDSQSPRYIQTLPRRGYRFIAPVESAAPHAETAESPVSSTLIRRRVFWLIGVGLAAIAAGLLVFNHRGSRDRISGELRPHIQSIAVMPIQNLSNDPEQEYFAEGMTDELITELSNIGALRVISRTSVMRYSGTKKPLPEIARELNVDALIEGSVLRSGNRVRINARLVDGSTERVLWEQTFERNLGDILALTSGAARSIAERIRITVTPEEQRRLSSTRPVKPRAYEAYLKGRFFMNKRTERGFHEAITYFNQALEEDPTYAAPYVGLADTYNLLGGYNYLSPDDSYPKAKAAAQEALSINESFGEAHTSLGLAGFEYDWNWPLAEREFRRGIEINSKYANGHLWYSYFLSGMGRYEEAMAEIRLAQQIDPLSLVMTMEVGEIDYFDSRFDPAVQEVKKALEMSPNFWRAHWLLGLAYMQKGTTDESILELEKATALSGNNLRAVGALGQAYAKAGRMADALKALDELKGRSKRGIGGSYFVASICVAMQENPQALHWLQRAYLERDRWLVFAKVDPSMSPLRSDPRFQNLLHRMNFPR